MIRRHFPLRTASIALFAGLALGGCGYGYGGLGGGVLSVGYGSGYGSYGGDYYGAYSGNPYWGWNSDYYYPGNGYYVYDRNRQAHRWSSSQQRYWTDRHSYWRSRGDRREFRQNWVDSTGDGIRDNRHDRRR